MPYAVGVQRDPPYGDENTQAEYKTQNSTKYYYNRLDTIEQEKNLPFFRFFWDRKDT